MPAEVIYRRHDGHPLDPYLRTWRLPHIWCPGCGIGIVLATFLRAVRALGISQDELVVVSGIGCTGRLAGYVNSDGAHVLHGRAIPFATGVKLARPDLKVVVISGDGDLLGIGLGHLIHAARRNVELTVIEVNNMIYALTGGQVAPTTPPGLYTTTTPYGNPEEPLDAVRLMAAAGACYVARWAVIHAKQLENSIKKALSKEGFAFIEVISPCVEVFGRHIGIRDAVTFYRELRRRCIVRRNPRPEESKVDWEGGEIICGEFVDIERPGFIRRLLAQMAGGGR